MAVSGGMTFSYERGTSVGRPRISPRAPIQCLHHSAEFELNSSAEFDFQGYPAHKKTHPNRTLQ